ncbi:MAG: hypothetical protein ACAH59_02755 [Pseudobdellovibrionaceae bacterium]
MKKIFLMAVLVTGLAACSSPGENAHSPIPEQGGGNDANNGEEGGAGNGSPDVVLTEITNTSECVGPAVEPTQLFEGMWYKEFEGSDGIKRKYVYEFDEDTMFTVAFCSGDGIQVRASVGGNAIITPATIEVTEEDSRSISAMGVSGSTVTCTAISHATPPRNYTFVGPCLQMDGPNGPEIYAVTR